MKLIRFRLAYFLQRYLNRSAVTQITKNWGLDVNISKRNFFGFLAMGIIKKYANYI